LNFTYLLFNQNSAKSNLPFKNKYVEEIDELSQM